MTGSKRTRGESSRQKDKSKEALPVPQKKTKKRPDRAMHGDPTPRPPIPHGMDEDIARWILEYLLRQPSISNQVVDSLLSTLPILNADLRLKKTLLFRQIESEYSHRSTSENILDILEHIEELDHQDGKEVTCLESMKAAYCAVAVDCTVKFLEDDGDNAGPYFEKVQSIWRERVAALAISENGLVSEELLGWKDRVEAAMWDSDVRFTIFRRNTRYEAVKAVRLYLREAWRDMGPAFLEVAAEMMRKMELDEQQLCGCGPGPGPGPSRVGEEKVGSVVNTCRELVVYDHHVVNCTVEGVVVEAESGGAGHGGESSMMMKPVVGDEVETLKKGTPNRLKHVAAHGRRTGGVGTGSSNGAKIVDTCGVQDHTHCNQYRYRPNPKVNKVQETIRSSSAKLSQVVFDPLPEAMYIAETVCSNREAQKVDIDAAIQNKKGSASTAAVESIEERAVQKDAHVDDALEDSHRVYDSAETGGEDGDRTSQNHGTLNTRRKPSLMERNSTAHVSHWDDSIDESASGSSMMPSSSRRDMLLTKSNGVVRITRRRQKKRWTADEEAALRTGVEKFGVGNWKLIHTAYISRFQDRTDGDLKDKWRNLMKSSG